MKKSKLAVKSIRPDDKVFHLKNFQDRFIFSIKRFLAFVGGWGTGKDTATIGRGMRLSQEFANNQGLIVRAELTDLQDSTMRDFEDYTGLRIDSSRNCKLSNGSHIMFRHAEEIADEKNLNNMNLGWFAMIQADEFRSDVPWFKLNGRLRRCHGTCTFAGLMRQGKNPKESNVRCDCYQSGFLSANANGEDWICDLFGSPELAIKGKLPEDKAELIEADSYANADVLPQAYVESWETIKVSKPEIYQRYVLNSRRVADDKFVVLPYANVRECVENDLMHTDIVKRVTVCDPAEGDFNPDTNDDDGEGGGDETVIYNLENSKIVSQEIYKHISLVDTEAKLMIHAKQNNSSVICVDKVGLGAKLYQDLCATYAGDENVVIYGFDGRLSAPDGLADETYANYKTYAWFKALHNYFTNRRSSIPNDSLLIRQLTKMRYKYTTGVKGGKYRLISKKIMKQSIGCSPDRAEAFIMGLDALDKAKVVGAGRMTAPHGILMIHPVMLGGRQGSNPHAGRALPQREWVESYRKRLGHLNLGR